MSAIPSPDELCRRAAANGDEACIQMFAERDARAREVATEAAIAAVTSTVNAAIGPVAAMLNNVGATAALAYAASKADQMSPEEVRQVLGTADAPPETPETPSPAADEEGAEENLDAARAAEAALPPDALPVGPGGEPPADQEEEDLPKTPSEDDLPPVPPAPEAPPDGDEQ